MAWIKVNGFNNVQYVAGISDTQTSENYMSLIRIGTDNTIGIYYRVPGQADWISGTTELTTGVYYHIALVANGSSWSLFINGQKEDITIKSGTNSGKWFSQVSGLDKFTVGSLIIQEPFTAPPFNGVIDQLLVYNRALTDAEISDINVNTK